MGARDNVKMQVGKNVVLGQAVGTQLRPRCCLGTASGEIAQNSPQERRKEREWVQDSTNL